VKQMAGSNLVSMEWLDEHLDDPYVKIVDCRFTLGKPESGLNEYTKLHIRGAFFLDLEKDLSAPKGEHGGRHPLPDVHELSKRLGEIGVHSDVKVVAYDDQGGAMASRLWWLLNYMGHREAYILNGSFSMWKKSGYPVTAQLPKSVPAEFKPAVQEDMLVTVDEVKNKLHKDGVVLIDSRDERRYLGIEEPIDAIAGHIPGAEHYFWQEGLSPEGLWMPGTTQKERFREVKPTDEVIVYCGSGVTACPNILALKEAGYTNLKLYAGSWSDWISYPDNPIETGKKE
jgi:thiosulfate/3-mercaptopyruvate sulfurtransferase